MIKNMQATGLLLFFAALMQACSLNTSGTMTLNDSVSDPEQADEISYEVDFMDTGNDLDWNVPDPDVYPDSVEDTVLEDHVLEDPVLEDPVLEDPVIEDTAIEDMIFEPEGDVPVEETFSCVPHSTWCVSHYSLATCRADGSGFDTTDCRFVCTDGPPARCMDEMVPSNLDDPSLLCIAGTGDLTVPGGCNRIGASTETGKIACYDEDWNELSVIRAEGLGLVDGINFATMTQPGDAPGLGIFSFERFTLPPGIEFRGLDEDNGIALVILSCLDVNIQGVLLANGDWYISGSYIYYYNGPGGGMSDSGIEAGGGGTEGGSYYSGGGGGGGFGGRGGDGGSSVAGGGGNTYGNDTLVPLYGGSGGGSGAIDMIGNDGPGGPGGGGLQISTPATITVSGVIEAGGCGGLRGESGTGGGGGGSGGSVLLEAHTITINAGAMIAANGGAGGSSGMISSNGHMGESGQPSLLAAVGGANVGSGSCDGANGSSATDINGQSLSCSEYNGGGGGGGAGRIRLNRLFDSIADDTLSPALDVPGTTTTQGNLHLR